MSRKYHGNKKTFITKTRLKSRLHLQMQLACSVVLEKLGDQLGDQCRGLTNKDSCLVLPSCENFSVQILEYLKMNQFT